MVRVRLHAAALNHLDVFTLGGLPGINIQPPWVMGADGAGVIDKAGDVARWKVPEPNGKRELVPVKNLHGARDLALLHETGCAIETCATRPLPKNELSRL